MNGVAPQLTNSTDAILEDEELMKMQVDVQKRFTIFHVCPKSLGGPSLRRGDTKECLNIPPGIG